jgi:hypothetical protein
VQRKKISVADEGGPKKTFGKRYAETVYHLSPLLHPEERLIFEMEVCHSSKDPQWFSGVYQ